MKLLNLLFLCSGILLITSCSSVKHTADVAPVSTKIVSYTVADLDVSPTKATQTYSWSFNPFRPVSISEIKKNTEARLLNEVNADVLVEPQYIINKRGFLRGGSVTVIGFPAKLHNFHKMTSSEAEIFNNVEGAKCNDKHVKRWIFF